MNAADYIAKYLQLRGVTHVFELIGGMITFLLDSLQQETDISIVSMHHEQGAGFAAEGYGRMKGVPGVAMATSGPGATDLLTAIGSCYFDSTPTVFITGQVNRHEQKGDRAVRQLGFQETDIVAMATPVTKAAWLVNDVDDVPRLLDRAFDLATSGRPGPVLLDLPMDVQRSKISDLSVLKEVEPATNPIAIPGVDAFVSRLLTALSEAERPLILAGGGIRSGLAVPLFRDLVSRLQIPVVNSLMAVDVLPSSDSLRVGLIGSYGNRWANTALSQSDLLLVLGSRLDVRQTGADTNDFKGQRAIYHVDCETGEMNNRVTGCETCNCELIPFLTALSQKVNRLPDRDGWLQEITALREKWPDVAELAGCDGLNPNYVIQAMSRFTINSAAVVVDVGQHQMWSAQSIQVGRNQRFLTSGGMGAMGFALPAAIGACLAQDRAPTVVIAGDGGFQLNIQELQTVHRLNLPLKMIVLNNQCHGMVRQFQESYFKGRYQSTLWGYSAPSFCSLAQAYGIKSRSVANQEELEQGLAECWAEPNAPFMLEVAISTNSNAYPKMAFGRGIAEMEPFAKPLDMEST